MNLNNGKNALTAKKILFVNQLSIYAELCQSYQDLAASFPGNRSSKLIENRYAYALSCASKGDFKSLKNDSFLQRFTPTELNILEQYSNLSGSLKFLGDASKKLDQAINLKPGATSITLENIESIDSDKMNDFHNYLRNFGYESGVYLDNFLQQHSRIFLGYTFNSIAKNAVERIDNIDQSHLQHPQKISGLTPASFGATLNGVNKNFESNNDGNVNCGNIKIGNNVFTGHFKGKKTNINA